jgi:CheY-like chemotaxis protein
MADSRPPSTPEEAGHSGNSSVVLIVDDNAEFAESCAGVLRAVGYTVLIAPDHRLALELLEGKQRIDLMLTDLVMPGRVNGMALARMARLRRPGLGLLYMTAYDVPGAESEAMATILRKPVDNQRLIEEVGRALRGAISHS